MDDQPKTKCPAEVYGVELVAEIMTLTYDSQEACAESHGCGNRVCLLEGLWPEETGEAGEQAGEESEEEAEAPPARRAAGNPGGSGWEFLGSD